MLVMEKKAVSSDRTIRDPALALLPRRQIFFLETLVNLVITVAVIEIETCTCRYFRVLA